MSDATRTCKRCSADLAATAHWATKYCSEACKKADKRDYNQAYYQRTADHQRQSAKKRHRANRFRRNEYSRKYYEDNREQRKSRQRQYYADNREEQSRKAMESYYARHDEVKAQRRARYADDLQSARAKAKAWRNRTGKTRIYNHNRKALLLAAFVEEVDPFVVFERDDWVCQHCGIVCPEDAEWPAKDFATIDHIVPISWGVFRGGFHSYANVQTLCYGCNSRKGAREAA